MTRLLVATLNVLNTSDRWPERLPLLQDAFAPLSPDIIGLQEVVFSEDQDRRLVEASPAAYEIHRGESASSPAFGNSILVRTDPRWTTADRPEAGRSLVLGEGRSAHAVDLALPEGLLRFATTHLHHPPEDEAVREQQARRLVAWLASQPAPRATIVVGDFNAVPLGATYARMQLAGYRSASVEANGAEPALTYPTGLVAGAREQDEWSGCVDYIWLSGSARALRCRLVFDAAAETDATLFPSDHYGLAAEVEIG